MRRSPCFCACFCNRKENSALPHSLKKFRAAECAKATPYLNFRPKRSGGLKQANEIAVGILDRCDEPARADILNGLLNLRTFLHQRLQRFLYVVHVEIPERPAHSRGMPVGKQADLLFADSKTDIIRLVHIWLAAQQLAEKALCPVRVFDRIDDGSDTVVHELKSPCHIHSALSVSVSMTNREEGM